MIQDAELVYDDSIQNPSHIRFKRTEKGLKPPAALSTVWEAEKQQGKGVNNVKSTMSLKKIRIRTQDAHPRLLFRGYADNEPSTKLKQYTMGNCPRGFCRLYEGGSEVEYPYDYSACA